MKRVVVDTNVFISGVIFGGLPGKIIRLITRRKALLVTSPLLLDELLGVLEKKFGWEESRLVRLEQKLRKTAVLVEPSKKIQIIPGEPIDNHLLACAEKRKVDAIITGDEKHLLPLKKFGKVPILTPKEFLKKC